MTCVRIKMKIDRAITAPHCIVTLCKLVIFHAYDQVAVHVYLYWTQDTIEGISFARDLLVTVNTVSSLLSMSLCFEIEIWFKLTTIDVTSGLQARNFHSSVIHHHEFSLIGEFNMYLGGRWPQLVCMTYYHDTGHIPKISNHSVIM